jgi:AcrR family transcriptional regulator
MAEPATTSLRERKKAETRAALQEAAMRLADERGPDKVTVEEVAASVGVSPRTFFNYFPSKDDAIIGMPSTAASPLLNELKARPAEEAPLVALRETVHTVVGQLQADPDRWALRTRLVRRHPALGARFSARMTELEQQLAAEIGARTGLDPTRDTYPSAVAGAVMSSVRAAMALWREHHPAPLPDLIDDYLDHLERGFTPVPPPTSG